MRCVFMGVGRWANSIQAPLERPSEFGGIFPALFDTVSDLVDKGTLND